MEQPTLRWRAKVTLHRSVQSQPDLMGKSTKCIQQRDMKDNTGNRTCKKSNRPHTAEPTVRFGEINNVRTWTATRPNTATSSGKDRLGSACSSATSGGYLERSTSMSSAGSSTKYQRNQR